MAHQPQWIDKYWWKIFKRFIVSEEGFVVVASSLFFCSCRKHCQCRYIYSFVALKAVVMVMKDANRATTKRWKLICQSTYYISPYTRCGSQIQVSGEIQNISHTKCSISSIMVLVYTFGSMSDERKERKKPNQHANSLLLPFYLFFINVHIRFRECARKRGENRHRLRCCRLDLRVQKCWKSKRTPSNRQRRGKVFFKFMRQFCCKHSLLTTRNSFLHAVSILCGWSTFYSNAEQTCTPNVYTVRTLQKKKTKKKNNSNSSRVFCASNCFRNALSLFFLSSSVVSLIALQLHTPATVCAPEHFTARRKINEQTKKIRFFIFIFDSKKKLFFFLFDVRHIWSAS